MNILSFRYAAQVSVGDEVIIARNDKLMPAKVTNVSRIIIQGNSLSYLFVFI